MKTSMPFGALRTLIVALLAVPLSLLAASESIYPDTIVPEVRLSDAPNWELGTIFRPLLPGSITHVRVFSLAEESGEHQVRIWRNADNTLIAGPIPWTYGGADGWITLDIPDVSLELNTDYTISVSVTSNGWYSANAAYFATAGNNGQNLAYPQAAGVFSDTASLRPIGSSGNAAYLRDILFEANLNAPLIGVQGNNTEIIDGDTTPSTADDTQFGGVSVVSGSAEHTFTITNAGLSNLELTGNPKVAISGVNSDDFTVTLQPAAPVPAGGSSTFTIRFDPAAVGALGTRNAAVSITNSATPSNPYDFAIQGVALSTGGGAAVLGHDGDGSFARNIDDSQIHGNRFVAVVSMRITALRAKVLELAGTFKCAVYSDTNGAADVLLASSVDVVNATNGWNTFALTSPLTVTNGHAYWLVIWADTIGARVQADPFGQAYWGLYYYPDFAGQWPDPIALNPLVGADPPFRTYCIYAEGEPLAGVPGPEIDLKGLGKLIVSGDTTPSDLDGTDFGNANLGSSQDRTFTVLNPGDTALALTGAPPVSVIGANAGDFVISSPPPATVPAGGTASFTVRFSPTAPGLRSATVRISSNDADENPTQFAVQGAGVPTGQETIFPDTKVGRDIDFDGTYYELGTIFQATVPGVITKLRVFSLASESGDHTARIWRNIDETVVGGPYIWNYGGATGWITFDIPDVEIEALTDYTVSISVGTSAKRNYPNIAGDLAAPGGNGQHLTYPVNAGVFTETRGARPMGFFNGGNYLRDIVFEVVTGFKLRSITVDPANGQPTLTWSSQTGATYTVERATQLGPAPSWSPIASNLSAAGATTSFTDTTISPGATQYFYRILQTGP